MDSKQLNDNNSQTALEDNQVLIELNKEVKQEELELLSMFLESKKKSDGGDISSISPLDPSKQNAFKVVFEDNQTKQRILKRKFFMLNEYYLRASELGYAKESYELNKCELAIRNIDIQLQNGDTTSNDYLIIKLYAEHLSPDNDVLAIAQSKLIPNTFYITYKDEFEWDKLLLRYNKKQSLRNAKLELFNSFKTNAFIIKSNGSEELDSNLVKNLLTDQILALGMKTKFFLDEAKSYVIFQFESNDDNEVGQLMSSISKSKEGKKFTVEYCHSLRLMNLIGESVTTVPKKNTASKYLDKGVQTDETYDFDSDAEETFQQSARSDDSLFGLNKNTKKGSDPILNQPVSSKSSVSGSIPDNALSERLENSLKLGARSTKTSISSVDNRQEATFPFDDQYYLDQLISSNNNDSAKVLKLDSDKFYTIAFANAKQIFFNIKECFNSVDKDLKYTINSDKSITIRNANFNVNPEWKSKLMDELKLFFTKRASYKTVTIPNEIKNDQNKVKAVQSILDTNKPPSLYFEIQNGVIHCYGTKNALAKKINELPEIFEKVKRRRNSSQSSMNRAGKLPQSKEPQSYNVLKASNVSLGSFKAGINPDGLISLSLINCKGVLNDLKKSLKGLQAELVYDDDLKKFFICSTATCRLDSVSWAKPVNKLISDYEKTRLAKKSVSIPQHLRKEKEVKDLEAHLNRFFDSVQTVKCEIKGTRSVNLYGLTKEVDRVKSEIHGKLANLENNIKDRIRRKLDLIVASKFGSIEHLVFSRFNDYYLKDFSVFLLKYEAEIHKLKNSYGYSIICTKENINFNETYATDWRKRLDEFIQRYFSKFSHRILEMESKKNELDLEKLDYDKKLVNLFWSSDFRLELVGIKADVDKLVNDLSQIPGGAQFKELDSSSTISNQNNSSATSLKDQVEIKDSKEFSLDVKNNINHETFLINDLKWYQTRILFEKKYFQYVTDTFKDLVVLLDTQLTRMFFKGNKNEIDLAKQLALDILDQILGAEIECDESALKKMSLNENTLTSAIKQNGLCCVVDTKSSPKKFTIFGTKLEEIEACKNLILQMKF